MAANDDEELQGVVVGVLGGIAVCVAGVMAGSASAKMMPPPVEAKEIAPVGEALAKVYFAVSEAVLSEGDKTVVALTVQALTVNPKAIVLLSGFHDPSGDAVRNAELAKARAMAVRDALVAGGVPADRVKLRKPESTVGNGSPEEGRRVEIRVQ